MLIQYNRIFHRSFRLLTCRNLSTNLNYQLDNIDLQYLCDKKNYDEIVTNIRRRKGPGDISAFLQIEQSLHKAKDEDKSKLVESLIKEGFKIPNRSHPETLALSSIPKVVRETKQIDKFNFKVLPFEDIAKKLNLTRTENLTNLTGDRSYYLIGQLAELEQALIDYAIDYLLKLGFQLISVSDILPRQIIEACGMNTTGERTQVYSLDEDIHGKDLCLSGTAEMGIGNILSNKSFSPEQLPLRLTAVSRCFRAETSKISEEKGIYRVHAFTKVEMFSVCQSNDSSSELSEFVSIEEHLFSSLGLNIRTLDMPPEELGAQAYRKFDVEAWLPGRKRWAELSSASDCTDFQSRRLNMKLSNVDESKSKYPYTLNGTAAAIPRLIMAIVETHQNADGSVNVPDVLRPYVNFSMITKSRMPPLAPYKGRTFYP